MLKIKLLHPDILMALASNGHGAKVLIADGDFPFSTAVPETAKKVFLNFAPDMLTVTDVLKVLANYIPIESATVMVPEDGSSQTIHKEFGDVLGTEVVLKKLKRFEFYSETNSSDTCLVIATGETRRFANLLLTLGVVRY
jgi:L-fucose mutarotase